MFKNILHNSLKRVNSYEFAETILNEQKEATHKFHITNNGKFRHHIEAEKRGDTVKYE